MLLHAIAHIESNAIDLAWDLVARFGKPTTPRAFFDDWVRVADDEARHFELLKNRLIELGSYYGEWPAHVGLWEAAHATRHDLAARLAVIPLILEARGLDVTPMMIARFKRHDDDASASILQTILSDEVGHVAPGQRWFNFLSQKNGHSMILLGKPQDLIRHTYPPLVPEALKPTTYGGLSTPESAIL